MYASAVTISEDPATRKPGIQTRRSTCYTAGMNWRRTLKSKSRQPRFLWRMVIGIIIVGIALGYLAQTICQPTAGLYPELDQPQPQSSPLDELARQGAWTELWWAIPQSEWQQSRRPGPVVLAALTGCCWLIFILQALQLTGPRDPRLWLALVGVLLGVFSIWPTLFFIYWQEHAWNLQDSLNLIPGIRYYVLGVGLREETAKLICLLPVMPLLLRLRSELAALLVSGCVGIGFAFEENAGYFVSSGGSDAMGRYLTANPFHMMLTALVGLAVYRGLRNPRDWGPQAVGVFGLIVFGHGLYDAFIALPALAEYSLFGSIIFVLVVYQFFRELRSARSKRPDTVSLTANFLCGVSLVTAATFIYLSATIGCELAFNVLAQGVLGLAVMVYLFLREMPETMVRV